jgi:hypothetical protein
MAEIDPRQLPRLDSLRRVAWLRAQCHAYTVDLAARHYFRLPTTCDGEAIPCPRTEALSAFVGLCATHHLTAAECSAAFNAEWSAGIHLAKDAGEKLRIAALSHLKMRGQRDRIQDVLQLACERFPAGWPHLTPANLQALSAGFQRPPPRRRTA